MRALGSTLISRSIITDSSCWKEEASSRRGWKRSTIRAITSSAGSASAPSVSWWSMGALVLMERTKIANPEWVYAFSRERRPGCRQARHVVRTARRRLRRSASRVGAVGGVAEHAHAAPRRRPARRAGCPRRRRVAAGRSPSRAAACRNRSGAGLPCATSSTLKIAVVGEAVEQPGGAQAAADPLVVAAGGDAARDAGGVERVERRRDARDRLQLARRTRRTAARGSARAARGQRSAPSRASITSSPCSHERPLKSRSTSCGVVGRPSSVSSSARIGAGEPLAVDEHAVAVEDDGDASAARRAQRPHGWGRPTPRASRPRARRLPAARCASSGRPAAPPRPPPAPSRA